MAQDDNNFTVPSQLFNFNPSKIERKKRSHNRMKLLTREKMILSRIVSKLKHEYNASLG
jgi:hypothetical protein